MKSNRKDILLRAAKTFLQAFLSALAIDGTFDLSGGDGFKRFLLTTGLSALAAGISAVWNFLLSLLSVQTKER